MLPPKRKRPRSGIERAPQRIWPRHRKFVRQFGCSVPLCQYGAPIEFAHYRTAANSGTGQRPHDMFGLSLCQRHHREQHQIGQAAFEKKYQFSMARVAAEFARKTTDRAMRESLALVNAEDL